MKAGRFLAGKLTRYADRPEVIVLALPRGGVPVAAGLARDLRVALDALVVRKIGLPENPEVALGAIAPGGHRVLNRSLMSMAGLSRSAWQEILGHEEEELVRRELKYREGRPMPDLHGRTVILVDDGLATGATMRVAVAAVRARGARFVVVAAPVASRESYLELREVSDEIVVAMAPREFGSVGQYYADFAPPSDEEVHGLLASAALEPVTS